MAQTTSCGWELGRWVCREQSGGGGINFGKFDPGAAQARGAAQMQAILDQQRRSEVGRLVAAGRCDEARERALRDGDFDLAQQVQQVCQ